MRSEDNFENIQVVSNGGWKEYSIIRRGFRFYLWLEIILFIVFIIVAYLHLNLSENIF